MAKQNDQAFTRTLSAANWEVLEALASAKEGNWFKDALADPQVFFALRDERVDAYALGARIYSIGFRNGQATPQIHFKYLIREPKKGKEYVALNGALFDSQEERIRSIYEPGKTLKEIKKATVYYVGVEAEGVSKAITKGANVIDIELSITQQGLPADGTEPAPVSERAKRRHDRIDIVQLQPTESGHSVVFWEAKHYSNSDLFNGKISHQLERYRKQILNNEENLLVASREICAFQARIGWLRRKVDGNLYASESIEMLERLSYPDSNLSIDLEPRIFAFGFDDDQKKGRWAKAAEKLMNEIGRHRVRAVGNPSDGLVTKHG